MRSISILSLAVGALASFAACAEPVKITNIGHGYFSAALSGMPLVGFLAGFGSLILIAGNIGPMLLGALLGGFMA